MKALQRYLLVILGCALVAFAFELLLIPNNIIPFGTSGIGAACEYIFDIPSSFVLLLVNLIIILFSAFFIEMDSLRRYLIPSLLIPIFIFIFSLFRGSINLGIDEQILSIVCGALLSGFGYTVIYRNGCNAGTIFLLEELIGRKTRFHSKLYSWIVDLLLIVLTILKFDYETAIYSIVVIFIVKYMITKVKFGINDSKVFYIVTSKQEEIKNFIMHDLKYEITVLDAKGGFSKKDNEILMTVISTKDYFTLKEGIKLIDPKAFITITDTYDVINSKKF